MYTLGINAAYHDSAACLVTRRRRRRRRRGGALHARQARQAAGPVLDVGAAVPRDRLLPARGRDRPGRRGSRRLFVRSVPAPAAGTATTRRSRCRWSPAPTRRPTEWEAAWDPLFLSSIVNAPRQLADGAPASPAATGSAASAPTARSAGTSSRTTSRTPPAPSTPRRSSAPP